MLSVLISGTLIRDPQTRTSQNGNAYTTALIRVPTNEEPALVSVIAFGELAESLAGLRKGDSVSVTGSGHISLYEDRNSGEPKASLALTAAGILTAYEVSKRRKAQQPGKPQPQEEPGESRQEAPKEESEPLDDELPF